MLPPDHTVSNGSTLIMQKLSDKADFSSKKRYFPSLCSYITDVLDLLIVAIIEAPCKTADAEDLMFVLWYFFHK